MTSEQKVKSVIYHIISVNPNTFLWRVVEKAELNLQVLKDIEEKEASVKTEDELIAHITDTVTAIKAMTECDLTKWQRAFFSSWVAFVEYTLHEFILKGIYPNAISVYNFDMEWRGKVDKLMGLYCKVMNAPEHDCQAVRDGWDVRDPDNNRRLMKRHEEGKCESGCTLAAQNFLRLAAEGLAAMKKRKTSE